MRFLADEGFDGSLANVLREGGHDIRRVTHEEAATDEAVVVVARDEHRILLTEDRDFGELVFANALATGGIIYCRFLASEREQVASELLQLLEAYGETLQERFVVLQPGRIRIGPLPNL